MPSAACRCHVFDRCRYAAFDCRFSPYATDAVADAMRESEISIAAAANTIRRLSPLMARRHGVAFHIISLRAIFAAVLRAQAIVRHCVCRQLLLRFFSPLPASTELLYINNTTAIT